MVTSRKPRDEPVAPQLLHSAQQRLAGARREAPPPPPLRLRVRSVREDDQNLSSLKADGRTESGAVAPLSEQAHAVMARRR